MIGQALHTGSVSEVVPVVPRPDVRAPLAMERLLEHARSQEMRTEAALLGALSASLGPRWQRLVSSDFEGYDTQFIYERFVGITWRDVCGALRATGKVLPIDVLRALFEVMFDGFAPLAESPLRRVRHLHLTDRSIGLGIDRQWRFAIGGLNHWLTDLYPPELEGDPEFYRPLAPDVMFLLSPEAFQGRPETPASLATRASLLGWQLATGGYHPYRGNRFEIFPSITRYSKSEVRVPLDVHPQVSAAFARVMLKGITFSGHRHGSLAELRAALDSTWPAPAASEERVFDLLTTLCWKYVQQQLHALRREPMLPIRWDGVWDASRTPEEGLAVLEDQFLERHVSLADLPTRGAIAMEPEPEVPLPGIAPPSPPPPRPPTARTPRVNLAGSTEERPARPGLLSRLLAFFGRT
ncbi:MAG: hypothetical protein U0228_36600 [Myxococcaceae bacterium]